MYSQNILIVEAKMVLRFSLGILKSTWKRCSDALHKRHSVLHLF